MGPACSVASTGMVITPLGNAVALRPSSRGRAPVPPELKVRTSDRSPLGPRKLTWKEQRELEGMEAAILEAESRKEALQERLADPALYARSPDEVARVTAEFREAGEQVDALYARWAELEEIATAAAGR